MSKFIGRSNICVVVDEYETEQGEKRRVWKTVGEIATFQNDDGNYSSSLKLYFLPGTRFSIFPQEKNERQRKAISKKQEEDEVPGDEKFPDEEIEVEKIPF